MKKFDKRIKVGTIIFIENLGWYIVKDIHETRKYLKVAGLVGEFTSYDVLKFSNTRNSRRYLC